MKPRVLAALAGLALTAGCVAPVGPVSVTRFHVPDAAVLGSGTIAVESSAGGDAASLETQTYLRAVTAELQRLGYTTPGGPSMQVASVKVVRNRFRPERARGPVSVGMGGSTGSYGSGVGLGIGIDLSGRPPEQVETELSVSIRDRKTGTVLWEGRASFTVKGTSPLADSQLGAPRLAAALFKGFPGTSGETIEVE